MSVIWWPRAKMPSICDDHTYECFCLAVLENSGEAVASVALYLMDAQK